MKRVVAKKERKAKNPADYRKEDNKCQHENFFHRIPSVTGGITAFDRPGRG
jgi:hypothetical protein